MYEVIKEKYEISLWDDVLVQEEEQEYEEAVNYNELETYYELVGEKTYSKVSNKEINFEQGKYYVKKPRKLSYFKEEKIVTIGADGHNSPEMVYDPKFVGNISGEHTLTFTISSKYIDKETGETVDNPYMKYLTNERKVKLFYRDEWYDLIIKKIEENKKNFSYTFTANDLFLNELGKNGFKVELNSELENNQGTAEELAAQVLDGTDWIVSSHLDEDEYKSDILVETNLDTLYRAKLNHDIDVVVSAGGWLPIREEDVEPAFTEKDNKDITTISKDEEVYLFYSDLIAKNPNPMILYRAKINDEPVYQVNENEDIIINSYNFRVVKKGGVTYNTDPIPVPDFAESIELEYRFRGYETIRRARTGYDPVTDEFITYFIKKEDESKRKGYIHTEYLSPDLAQNYLANSTDFTDVDAGWTFDGLPQSGKRAGELTSRITEKDEKKAMMLLHLSEKDELYQSQVGSIVKTCLALSQDGETIQTKNEPVQLKDEDEKQKWVNLLKEEYLKFIFPQLFASGDLLKESVENPSEQLVKELELVYSFEYTEEEFTEYVKSALSILNEIIDYSDGDGYLIKFDRFGIKKNRISKKIEQLKTSAQEKNNNIESLVSGLSELLDEVQINTTDLGGINQILLNAANNIEDTEKKNILDNLFVEVNGVQSFNEDLYATLLDKATGKYIKTENEIFDEAISSLEEPVMQQEITDLVIDLINEIKDIIKGQIDKRFVEHLSVLRYEERRHRALNEGVSGNRTQIERLNKGEKYVFALSLGTYIEDKNKDENEEEESGPTLEDSDLKVTYGFKDEEQFYFSKNPVGGVGDYVVATEKFKQVTNGEEDGYMTNAPRFIQQDDGEYKYIAYENKKDKYEIQYILKDTVISLPFYEDENGECVCIEKKGKRQYKPWKEVGSFQKVLDKNDKLVTACLTSENKVKKYRPANYYEGETFTLSSQFGYGEYKKDLKPSNSQSSEETFSLYSAADALPELYCFIPDALGDYVHIIFDNPAAVQTKWYEVWTNPDNLNKKYRDFKEGDETITDAIHYFKRYNSNLDYDYHRASLDDGHLGPWKEKYQRYSKHRVSLYGGGTLSSEYSYWFSSPFEDGSECYIPFSYYQIERFDFEESQPLVETTSLRGVVFDYVTFNSEQGIFTTHRNSEGIPVKRTEKTYRVFNTEKDSQRVPLVMKKTEENPKAGVHYVYCNGVLANETGYYRLCTKEEVWLYNQWKNKESIDNIGKIFSPWLDINWNPDEPPIEFYVYQEASKDSEEKKWVKEIRNGILRIIPYDRDLHENKTKYYRHSVASEEIPAKEVYYNAGDIYKRVIDEEDKTIGLNYENLRVSFCEYEYDSSIFKIDIKENSEKPILDFDCSKTPKYFDLTHHGLDDNLDPIIIKERYAWWESTVENTYNLVEDLHTKVGIVFKTENGTEQTYPILGAQLFKYKTYKSNNHETLVKFKQQIGDNEAHSLTFDEYKKFKKAFQGFFGYDEWNKIEADYGIDYLGQLSEGSYSKILSSYSILDKEDSIFMVLPGEAPHDSDLVLSNYYIYDPTLEGQDKEETIEYEYIGNDPFELYDYDYDDECQKVRGIETKEKNYLSALSAISEKFECWIKYELQHHTEGENKNLPMRQYDIAHTPGEVKMIEQTIWINENDETDIIFNPLNAFNSHRSDLSEEVLSALSQFNPSLVSKESEQNTETNKNYIKTIQTIPFKKIYLKQFTGNLNYAGFKYGVNLSSIKRTLDSKDLVSKLIVKENTNELGIDGFCTIQRAAENPTKENFILDFDYYIQHRMLNKEEVWEDLYGKSGYFSQLAEINKNLTDLVNETAEANECLDRINAKYETYSLARDAAQEEIDNLANLLMDSLKDGVPVPWKFNMDKEVTVMETSWSDEQTKVFEVKDEDGNVIDMSEYIISGQERSIEIPKYNEETRKRLIQMDTLQREFTKYYDLAEKEKNNKELYEKKLVDLYKTSDEMYQSKENLNKLFFKKYYRFIQEGSWKEDKYFDDTLYYLDALAVSRTSAFPKVTYDIQVIDLQALKDYKAYSFGMGDKTYIEDTEFFGYTSTNKPYQEEVIITKFEYQLDNPSKNKITVQNYKTQFEDVFKRIAAAVSKVELQTGGYNRGNVADNVEGDLSSLLAGTTTFEDGGLVSTEIGQSTNKIRIANGAIYGTTDGGATYFKIFSAKDGISPALINDGKLNLENLIIGSESNPGLKLDNKGMTAFCSNDNGVDYSSFVRFDNYGVYSIKNYKRSSSTNDATNATLSDIFVPTDIDSIYENASFGLTWNGFFLNTGDGTGRVSIGTEQDLKMSVKDVNNAWQDRLIIGKLQDGTEPYYGFRIIDDNKNVVLNTDDRGQLYLRHRLHISHFNDEYGTVTEGNITKDKKLDQTNVTLGIVKAYKRLEDGGYAKGEDLHDNYSSLDYLTKVFSVKSAVDGYDLKGALKDKKNLFKQFTKEQLEVLIDPNENLAIFDNGNLYAKNAWIEGNIRATGGNILGNLMVGIESPNKTSIMIEGEKGRISAKRLTEDGTYFEPWAISHDGEAHFQDAIISGTLSSTVFEYDKIQTVAGAMLIRPGTYAEKVEIIKYDNQEKYIRVTLQTSNNQQTRGDFPIEGSFNIGSEIDLLKTYNSIPPFGNNEEYGFYINYFDFSQSNIEAITFVNEEETIDFERIIKISVDDEPILLKVVVPFADRYSEENLYEKRIKIKTNLEEMEFSIIRPLDTVVQDNELYLEFFDDYTPSLFMEKLIAPITKERTIALGINASTTSFLPPESFSIVEIFQENTGIQRSIPHAVFGRLTTEIPELPYNLINSYGLYCDNVILKGSLITSGDGGYTAGVSTRDEKTVLIDEQEEKIVFWAGQQTFTENDSSKISYDFYVTKSGYLHANKGIFSGVVRAAVLETSTLIGTNSEEGDGAYGLTITSNRSLINSEGSINAILFNSYEGKPYFSLTSLSAEFHIPLLVKRQEEGNKLPLFTIINTENQSAIGFFGTKGDDKDAQQYCLNFIEKEESILLRYRDKTVMTVNENGAFISGAAKWADNIEIEQVKNGCDVYII